MRFGVENFDQLEQFVLHLHEACLAECGIPGHGVQVLAQRSEPAVEARAGKSLHECRHSPSIPIEGSAPTQAAVARAASPQELVVALGRYGDASRHRRLWLRSRAPARAGRLFPARFLGFAGRETETLGAGFRPSKGTVPADRAYW